ncbi:MAG: VOC family protein [Fimbriimonadaceae bacterium]|nr:VOC family protein [Fimbriimonadaceae bacterium]
MPRMDAIGIVVEDLERTRAFYALLGMELPVDGPHVEAVLPGGLRVMFDSASLIREFDPNWPGGVGRTIGLAFLCESPTEVDEVYARVIAAGHRGHKEPWDAFWGQRYATVLDPDGHSIDLFAPLLSS